MTNKELINLAIEARKNAMSPTKYYCGAAVLADNGEVYTGCNLGSDDGIFNICAEQVAISKMLSNGVRGFKKIAVVGGPENSLIYTTPCGVCRQLISEFGKNLEIIIGFMNDNNELEEKILTIEELLPAGFLM